MSSFLWLFQIQRLEVYNCFSKIMVGLSLKSLFTHDKKIFSFFSFFSKWQISVNKVHSYIGSTSIENQTNSVVGSDG